MPSDPLSVARGHYESGNVSRAEELCRQLVDADERNAAAWHLLGLVSLGKGRPEEAVEQLQRAIGLDGADAEFHNHLGVALAGLGRMEQAVDSFRRATELSPGSADAHYNLGNALRALSRFSSAVSHYLTAARLKPDGPEIHYNLGNTYRDLRKRDRAAECYREALRLRPGYMKAQNNLGNVLRDSRKYEESEQCYREALRLRPDYAEAIHNLGILQETQGKVNEAVASFRKALQLKPDFGPARNSLGKALVQRGDLDEALALLQEEKDSAEDCVDAQLALGEKLRREGRIDEAIACAREVLEKKAGLAMAHNNLGLALLGKDQLDEAVACYRRAIELKPDFADGHNNLAVALQMQGCFGESLQHIEHALRIRPQLAVAHLNRAMSWLRIGDFQRGWHEYEWRRLCEDRRMPSLGAPLWDGSPMPDGTVLLQAEQGLGDTMQFVRYAPLVKQRCKTVILRCQKALTGLLQRSPGIDQLAAKREEVSHFDVQIPLVSLPGIFDTTLQTIPAEVPYVLPDQRLVVSWKERLHEHSGFRVGIAWQGNAKYAGDKHRSIPLQHFQVLARVPGVEFFCLQRGRGQEQVRRPTPDFPLVELDGAFDKTSGAFMDTAAVMHNLDLVITSDTSIPHLAGSMGVPVWVALGYAADWRWLDGREDCRWYPTMRLFRQTALGDWDGVFDRIASELAALVGGDASRLRPGPAPISRPIQIPASHGELVDKITILEIKAERISDEAKRGNVRRELSALRAVYEQNASPSPELTALAAKLKQINEQLWEIEDAIRACEAHGDFGPRFIELARRVYKTNDRRSAVKRSIDRLFGSTFVEEKQYVRYD